MPAQGVLPRTLFPSVADLEDRSYVTVPFVTMHGNRKLQTVTGTGHGKNSLCQHGKLRILGILRLRAHHLGKAPTRRGAPLRMTEGGVMEETYQQEINCNFNRLELNSSCLLTAGLEEVAEKLPDPQTNTRSLHLPGKPGRSRDDVLLVDSVLIAR